jgi:hypothetical protein
MFKRCAAILGLVTLAAGMAFATSGSGTPAVSPDEALQKLMDGNQRYVENQMTGTKLCDLTTRSSLAKSQKPYAIILTCSDSRVPQKLFLIRVSGRYLLSVLQVISPTRSFWVVSNMLPNIWEVRL